VFGIATSTLLVLFVLPCLYTILEDFGLASRGKEDAKQSQMNQDPALEH